MQGHQPFWDVEGRGSLAGEAHSSCRGGKVTTAGLAAAALPPPWSAQLREVSG